MRMRSVVLVAVAAVGASWVGASSASALELGPVSVPVTLPTIGPVVVEAPAVAPQLGVTATVSPATGVAVDVTTPSALGPIPLAGASHSVHVGLGAGGGSVVVAPTSTGETVAAPTRAAAPVAAMPRIPAPEGGRRVSSTPPTQPGLPEIAPAANASAAANAPSPAAPGALARDNTSGVVNASLRHAEPGGIWDLWRGGTSARLLWLALLLIALAGNWVVGGFIRDALRRSRVVSPA